MVKQTFKEIEHDVIGKCVVINYKRKLYYLKNELYEHIIKEQSKEHNKEKDKWIEERSRMAKLLFSKGIYKW